MKNHRLMRLLGVVQEGAHPIASFPLIGGIVPKGLVNGEIGMI
jgi:hypothetical protein